MSRWIVAISGLGITASTVAILWSNTLAEAITYTLILGLNIVGLVFLSSEIRKS